MTVIYPWIKYARWPLLLLMIFVFIILRKKERGVVTDKELQDEKVNQQNKYRVGLIGRIISGILGFILLIMAGVFCIGAGFSGYPLIIVSGGFGVGFLWTAISGKKSK